MLTLRGTVPEISRFAPITTSRGRATQAAERLFGLISLTYAVARRGRQMSADHSAGRAPTPTLEHGPIGDEDDVFKADTMPSSGMYRFLPWR